MADDLRESMGLDPKEFDREAIEQTLCRIAEVEAARIVVGHANEIEELHVLALPDKGPKQIVRDIESALMACFGLALDHKKISIAQLGVNGNGAKSAVKRIKIGAVNTETSDLKAKVRVELRQGEAQFYGIAEGVASQAERLRLAAEATLRAVEQWTKAEARFSLEGVTIVRLGSEQAAVACISMISSAGEASFIGSAIVKNSENDAVVKATLAAINRRVGI